MGVRATVRRTTFWTTLTWLVSWGKRDGVRTCVVVTRERFSLLTGLVATLSSRHGSVFIRVSTGIHSFSFRGFGILPGHSHVCFAPQVNMA